MSDLGSLDVKLDAIWIDYNMGMITTEERNRRVYLLMCENPMIKESMEWFAEKVLADAQD